TECFGFRLTRSPRRPLLRAHMGPSTLPVVEFDARLEIGRHPRAGADLLDAADSAMPRIPKGPAVRAPEQTIVDPSGLGCVDGQPRVRRRSAAGGARPRYSRRVSATERSEMSTLATDGVRNLTPFDRVLSGLGRAFAALAAAVPPSRPMPVRGDPLDPRAPRGPTPRRRAAGST